MTGFRVTKGGGNERSAVGRSDRDYSPPAIRMIAAGELAGVAGLILPGLLGRALVLAPLAAIGLGW